MGRSRPALPETGAGFDRRSRTTTRPSSRMTESIRSCNSSSLGWPSGVGGWATMKSLIARLTGMLSGMSAARIWAMKTGSLTVLLLRCVIDSVSVGERPTPDAGEPMSGAGHPEGRGTSKGLGAASSSLYVPACRSEGQWHQSASRLGADHRRLHADPRRGRATANHDGIAPNPIGSDGQRHRRPSGRCCRGEVRRMVRAADRMDDRNAPQLPRRHPRILPVGIQNQAGARPSGRRAAQGTRATWATRAPRPGPDRL